MTKSHVNTAMEARILRNVPFAEQGYAFTTPQLTAIFSADGGWYKPVPGKSITLLPTHQSCVDTLKAQEARLRAAQPMSDILYDWMLTQTDLYLTLRRYTEALKPFEAPSRIDGPGCYGDGKPGARWVWLDRACPPTQDECGGVVLECDAACRCTAGVGG